MYNEDLSNDWAVMFVTEESAKEILKCPICAFEAKFVTADGSDTTLGMLKLLPHDWNWWAIDL